MRLENNIGRWRYEGDRPVTLERATDQLIEILSEVAGLYSEPSHCLNKAKGRVQYADTTEIICIGDQLVTTGAEALSRVYELMI